MFCPKCGTQNNDGSLKCSKCGQVFNFPTGADYTLGGLIPYKNPAALLAYYLGVFSLIPCLGIFFGLFGLKFGLKGLRFSKENPNAGGRLHAYVGIFVGGFFGVLYLAATILLAFIYFASKKP